MEELNPEKFEKAKIFAEETYHKIGDIFCPYFQEKVIFNAMGLEHLKFKGRNRARLPIDQYIRLRLISLAPEVIHKSHTLQGLLERKNFEREKTQGKWQSTLRQVYYYEFVSVIKRARIRVIVKQVENGPKHFWSIIPFWKMDSMGKRKLHNGNPEED